MATTTSISFASVDSGGDKLNKAISDINPNATADKLVGFTKKLNGLTNNTYVNTVKIEKTELDTATPKTAATLTISNISTGDGIAVASDKLSASTQRSNLVNTDSIESCFVGLDSNSDGKPFIVSRNAFVMVDFCKETQSNKWIVILLSGGAVDDWSTNESQPVYDVQDNIIARYPNTGNTGDVVIALAESDTYTQSNTVTIHITA